MVDNRYATALVIACVLSILATVYLSVAIGTQHWYQYSSPTVRGEANVSELRSLYEEFMDGEFDEKTYSDTLFRLNGTVGLWWRCVLVPASWYKEPGMWLIQPAASRHWVMRWVLHTISLRKPLLLSQHWATPGDLCHQVWLIYQHVVKQEFVCTFWIMGGISPSLY